MSTLKVGAIRGVSATSDAITIANDGTADANLTSIAGAQLSNRNLLMNGEMIVAQRSTSAVTNSTAGSSLKYDTIDRWGYWANAASVFSIQQVDDSPVGFSKSLKFTSAGARSIVAGDYYMVGQGLEGGDIQHLNWGTANAKDCVLSFHVKSSLTGTFTGYLHGDDNFKPTYVFTYTILQANTWEKKDITITAPGTGQSGDFGSAGSVSKALEVGFNLGVGTTYATTTINAWHEGFFKIGTTTSVDVVATNGATWQVTGVQMEINNSGKPTEYEHRPFQQELLLCQRYAYVVDARGSIDNFAPIGIGRFYNGTDAQIFIPLPTTMRLPPAFDANNTTSSNTFFLNSAGGFGGAACTQITMNERSFNAVTIVAQSIGNISGQTAGIATTLYADDADDARLMFIAEL